MRACLLAVLLLLALAAPVAAQVPPLPLPPPPVGPSGSPMLDPAVEASNYSKTTERQALYDNPQGQLLLRKVSQANGLAALQMQLADPEREFTSDLCWNGNDGCAGDARLYDWQAKGYGVVTPVLFTARNGATLSGHVWATRSGPRRRPGVVITNGSVQADEQMYWYAAQALAKAGYVVLTFDPQGQGQSDTFGEGADRMEGVPAQSDGRPFFDGTEDAIDFFMSSPAHPYVPVTSCETGTSHAAKQSRRVAAGLDAAYNPYWKLFDRRRLGLAGHSYGAAGVSYVGQADRRVKAIVAWDNLSRASAGSADGSFPPGEKGCPAHPERRRPAALRAPALGMSADYFLPPTPNTSYPDQSRCPAVADAYAHGTQPSMSDAQTCKSLASVAYSRAGVDTGEIVIRGGSHLDFSFISNPAFGATLRGADLIDWYTTAWFDKYVKGSAGADRRLLTDRWRRDGTEASVDPGGDGNLFSFYHPSRLAITRSGGGKVDCEDLRAGCSALSSADGWKGDYSYIALARSRDGGRGAAVRGAGLRGRPGRAAPRCVAGRRFRLHVRAPRGTRIVRIVARRHGHVVGRSSGARARRGVVRVRLARRALKPRGRVATIRLRVTLRRHGKRLHATVARRVRHC